MRIIAIAMVTASVLGAGYVTFPSSAHAQQPQGSFRQTCRHVRTSRGVVSAQCLDARGRWRNTSLDFRGCPYIANHNGSLTCSRPGGGPPGGGRPGGRR